MRILQRRLLGLYHSSPAKTTSTMKNHRHSLTSERATQPPNSSTYKPFIPLDGPNNSFITVCTLSLHSNPPPVPTSQSRLTEGDRVAYRFRGDSFQSTAVVVRVRENREKTDAGESVMTIHYDVTECETGKTGSQGGWVRRKGGGRWVIEFVVRHKTTRRGCSFTTDGRGECLQS